MGLITFDKKMMIRLNTCVLCCKFSVVVFLTLDLNMALLHVLILIFVSVASLNALPTARNEDEPQCGYKSCPVGKPDMLNVHIISHTHDDVGWLKTVDQYYYGANNSIQNAGVQYILDSVVQELHANPERKFIYVETAFFWKWWQNQDDATRHVVKSLVNSGQLEFIGGGWSMNDEAAADYNDIIDQMSLGLRRLRSLFGNCGIPKVGWQIDPFGHSREQASLFAQMGFDGLFLGRIDYQDKAKRLLTKSMEMMWNASANIGEAGQLFTGVLFNNYSPPPGFCFDLLCDDEPIIDDPESPEYNVERRVSKFIDYCKTQAKFYTTNNIAITMGNDFNYQSARTWFKNLDKLIKYTNEKQAKGSKVNVMYSNPACYLYALNQAKISLTTKTDDFFPYASDPHAYWTGYFTSRPALKGAIRKSNNFLQICKQLHFISRQKGASGDPVELFPLKENLGIAQHHDAVTGTAKQHVTDDYMRLLALGTKSCQDIVNEGYEKLMALGSEQPPVQVFCNALNVSQCDVSEQNKQFTVTVYNPIGRPVEETVRIPVVDGQYSVVGPDGKQIQSQLVPIPDAVIGLTERKSIATHELVFPAIIPAIGFQTFFISEIAVTPTMSRKIRKHFRQFNTDDVIISNEFLKVRVDGSTGLLREITNLKEQLTVPVLQDFRWYPAMSGNNTEFKYRASGAYIFRPNGTSSHAMASTIAIKVFKGAVVDEIHQVFNSWVSQVIRLPKTADCLELEWLIGPIPIDDGVGKEILSIFQSDLETNDEFYTDSNGREVLKRQQNVRYTYKLNVTESVSGNYYPVNSRIFIRDEKKNAQLTVLTDRSVGGSSIEDGSIELMLHRRLLHDDAFGVGEALNEPGFDGKGLVVRGRSLILLTSVQKSFQHRDLAQRTMLGTQMSFTNSQLSPTDWRTKFATQFSALNTNLPPNVHLLTLEPLDPPYVLLRLEHFYEQTDDPEGLSKPVSVELDKLFQGFTLKNVTETNLAANELLSEVQRLKWTVLDNSIPPMDEENITRQAPSSKLVSNIVELHPMQIRTFIIQIESSTIS